MVSAKQAVSAIASDIIQGDNNIQVIASDESRGFRSKNLDIALPLIILYPNYYLELDTDSKAFVNKRVLFARDDYTCQYCGLQATPGQSRKQLTLDHVRPAHLFASRAEATTWENVTTACLDCNQKKAGHLPRECGMMPKKLPRIPDYVQLRFAGKVNDLQRNYINDYYRGEYVL